MQRKDAIALLKEMAAHDLGEFSWVVLIERKLGDYQLQIGSDCSSEAMEKFMDKNDLVFEEEPINHFIIIYKR